MEELEISIAERITFETGLNFDEVEVLVKLILTDIKEFYINKNETQDIVKGSFSDWYQKGFKDGLLHRSLKCRCGKN